MGDWEITGSCTINKFLVSIISHFLLIYTSQRREGHGKNKRFTQTSNHVSNPYPSS